MKGGESVVDKINRGRDAFDRAVQAEQSHRNDRRRISRLIKVRHRASKKS